MENTSKALLIAAVALMSILLISISIFLYNNSKKSIDTSLSGLNNAEISAINQKYGGYDGVLYGSKVKIFIGKLIANSQTYQDDTFYQENGGTRREDLKKIPTVEFNIGGATYTAERPYKEFTASGSITNEYPVSRYVGKLNDMRDMVDNLTEYYSEYEFNSEGLISKIVITDEVPAYMQ